MLYEVITPNPLEKHLSVGNELLYGWLVGRAAADLGLAQALASSDAHYGERIKRMEESLVTQIQELKNNQSKLCYLESMRKILNCRNNFV